MFLIADLKENGRTSDTGYYCVKTFNEALKYLDHCRARWPNGYNWQIFELVPPPDISIEWSEE